MTKTFTTAFNRSVKSIRDVNCVKFTKPSKVKASLAYATDINEIYKNYCQTGNLPLNGQQPIYDENFIKYDSLVEAQKLCDEACAYFNGLPANIKNQYGNDLRKFIQALNNNDDFLIQSGLLVPRFPQSSDDIDIKPSSNNEGPINTPEISVNTATTE